MKLAHRIIAVTSFAVAAVAGSVPALAASTDPIQLIYRASGVRDDGSAANTGVATIMHCTNASDVPEEIQFLVRGIDGTLKGNASSTIPSAAGITISTHAQELYLGANFMGATAGVVINGGYLAIGSSSTNIFCSAEIIDAANTKPVGIPLHLIRYNPIPGTLE